MRSLAPWLLLLAGMLGAQAQANDAVRESSWFVWNARDFFDPCAGDCGAAFYAGREITTPMSSVFLVHNPVAPWNDQTGLAGVIATSMSRRFATLFGALDLEAEAGLDQRLGDMHATTVWLAVVFRWNRFPWNDTVLTTIAFADSSLRWLEART